MIIEEEIFNYIKNHPLITAIIGAGNDCRLYPVLAPMNAKLPYIVVSRVSNMRVKSSKGYANLQRARMQLSCYASSYNVVKDLSMKIIDVMEKFDRVKGSFHENDNDFYDDKAKAYCIPIDFFIWAN